MQVGHDAFYNASGSVIVMKAMSTALHLFPMHEILIYRKAIYRKARQIPKKRLL